MATLEWGDTFDHYTKTTAIAFTDSPMAKKWTSVSGGDDSAFLISPEYARPGAAGGNGIRCGNRQYIKALPGGSRATRCAAAWWNPGSLNTLNQPILAFLDAGTEQVSVRLNSSSKIIVTRNGTLLATSTNAVSANTWYWIEFKATINNSTGVYEVKVNGTSVGWIPQATGANTRASANNSADQLALGQSNGTAGWWMDDVVVADDFVGQLQGFYCRPVGPGNHTDFTPNAGSNDGAVRNPMPDDDNSFNASTTSGDIDTFVMEKLPVSGTPTILGIQHVIYAKQDAGVQRTLRPKQRSSATDYSGTSVNTGTSYALITEAKPTDPDTGAAWTKTSFEAAEFGYENV